MQSFMEFVQPGMNAMYAMATFSDNVRTDFDFLPQLDAAARISNVTFPNGQTNTQAGLAQASSFFVSGECQASAWICADHYVHV